MNFSATIRERPWRIDLSPLTLGAVLCSGVFGGAAILAAFRNFAFARDPVGSNALFYAALLAFTLAAFLFVPPRGGLAGKLGLRRPRLDDLRPIVCGLAAIYLFHFLSTPLWGKLLDALGIKYAESQNLMLICRNASPLRFLSLLALAGAAIPFAEEIVFRRTLFGMFVKLGPIPALLISAFIFSALHFYLYGFWSLWALGAVFQWMYLRTGNLASPVIAHIVFNAVSLTAAFCGG